MMNSYPAPAKVNLHLAITDIRDDGLHVLDTSFVYVDVGDVLSISLSNKLQVRCSDASLNGQKILCIEC
ncbi:MAG: hypothetical protein Q9N67_08945 [Ghiorsea sp.]|nr:hypothetical protein [Ghiorsea sp.]